MRSLCAAILLIGSLAGAELPAPDDEKTDALEALLQETVVTGASKSAEVASVAPATVTVITAESLSHFGIHSLDEALNYLSLGMVTQNPLHSVDIGSRGVLLTSDFGNHVLLLLNGQSLNEQWDGTAYFERGAGIPWELIDHIEVIVGPGSVLYGSNAMFGVINVVTKRAKDYGHALITIDAQGSSPVDSQGNVNLRHLSNAGGSLRVAAGGANTFTLLGHDAEVVGQVEHFIASGPTFTFAAQNVGNDSVTGQPKNFGPETTPGVWGGLATHSYATQVTAAHVRLVVDELSVELRAASYWRSTPYSNEFNATAGDFNDPDNGELDRFLNLDLRYAHHVTPWLGISLRAYGALYDFHQSLKTSAAQDCADGQSACIRKGTGSSQWAGLEAQGSADWASDGKWVTLLGVDGRVRQVAGAYDLVPPEGTPSVSYGTYERFESVLGLYLQQEARPLRWLSFNVGGRLDIDSRFGARLSPRAVAAVSLPWAATLKLLYAEAFRGPTAYELYYTDGTTQIAAKGLRPETVRSGELSYEQRVGLQRFLIGGFVSSWENMVALSDATQTEIDAAIADGSYRAGATEGSRYRNLSRIANFGGNASFEGSASSARWRYGLNVTVAHTERIAADGSSTLLTVAPQVFGNARISYELGEKKPTLGLIAFFAAPRPADRANDGGWPTVPMAPAQFDLKATLGGDVPGLAFLSYRASVTYAFGARTPYVVGPLQAASPTWPMPQLAPVDRLQLGLQLLARWP